METRIASIDYIYLLAKPYGNSCLCFPTKLVLVIILLLLNCSEIKLQEYGSRLMKTRVHLAIHVMHENDIFIVINN